MSDINEINRLTMNEYNLFMTGRRLKRLDEEYIVHLQSFTNQTVKSTRGSGKNVKPMYPTFKSFFDYEKQENDILGINKVKSEEDIKMMNLMRKLNRGGG